MEIVGGSERSLGDRSPFIRVTVHTSGDKIFDSKMSPSITQNGKTNTKKVMARHYSPVMKHKELGYLALQLWLQLTTTLPRNCSKSSTSSRASTASTTKRRYQKYLSINDILSHSQTCSETRRNDVHAFVPELVPSERLGLTHDLRYLNDSSSLVTETLRQWSPMQDIGVLGKGIFGRCWRMFRLKIKVHICVMELVVVNTGKVVLRIGTHRSITHCKSRHNGWLVDVKDQHQFSSGFCMVISSLHTSCAFPGG